MVSKYKTTATEQQFKDHFDNVVSDNMTAAERMEFANMQDQMERNSDYKIDANAAAEILIKLGKFLCAPGKVK